MGSLAYEQQVDRLLASPLYGERMAMEWLDGARFADTNGYQNDFARIMWPWRDWVIAAYNRNQPFDRFLIDQVAGDLLPGATLSQKIATGFNRNNRTVTEAGSIEEEWRIENAVDRVETTATVFLGLTMGCARCHDHKFDPISQTEFYQFLGFFNSVNEKGVYTETRGNVPPLISLPTERETKQHQRARFRFGCGQETRRQEGSRKTRQGEGSSSKGDRQRHGHGRHRQSAADVCSQARPVRYAGQGAARRARSSSLAAVASKGREARPTGPGRWLTSPENPLTARVAVNRIWQHHFGTGLVKTAENFGIQGEPPSHPELLDWLASELIRSGWDVKAMHKLIVTSATYRQRSSATPALLARDPENRLLARGPRFRLPAEVVRDNALAIAGLLVKKIGGPSVKPYQPAGLWEELAGGAGEAPYVQDKGPGLYRRSLYVYRKRTVPHPLMATFDAPSREVCQVKRPRTNTPLQALELLERPDLRRSRSPARPARDRRRRRPRLRPDQICVSPGARTRAIPGELELLLRGLKRYLDAYRADLAAARAVDPATAKAR